jgi:hypothetical protein
VFLVVGGWLISAVENALINALGLPLAVARVWVVFDEIPTGSSLVGGGIVMAAVLLCLLQQPGTDCRGNRLTLAAHSPHRPPLAG